VAFVLALDRISRLGVAVERVASLAASNLVLIVERAVGVSARRVRRDRVVALVPLSLVALRSAASQTPPASTSAARRWRSPTSNQLRGRVSAVEDVFISASNQLGAFESAAAAALLGTVPSVIAGGLARIAIAAAWTRVFPSLARLDDLEALQPEPAR
jgi:hypothetical protein